VHYETGLDALGTPKMWLLGLLQRGGGKLTWQLYPKLCFFADCAQTYVQLGA